VSFRTIYILIFAVSVSGGIALKADVIYTNFGTGDAYSSGAGIIVTNDNQAWSSVAIAFTPSASYDLTSIELVATDIIPDYQGATFGIFADNGSGQPVGAPLESFTQVPLGQFGTAVPVLTLTSLLQPLLLANTQYWIGMNAPADDFIVWNQNITSSLGFSQTDGSGNWSTSNADQGVVEIDGTLDPSAPTPIPPAPIDDPSDILVTQTASSIGVTPEPRAWWLMAGGLAAIAICAKRARFTNQKQ
jgi:hypothetical protein